MDFRPGDKVRHAAKPEWGVGRVEKAERADREGQPGQKVIVTFANRGRVTLHTGFAALEHVAKRAQREETQSMEAATMTTAQAGNPIELLKALPEAATDPLSGLAARLAATLALYRYTDEARTLLEWASDQTGLDDAMSLLNRHELEQAFGAFAQARDRHLRELLRAARKAGKPELVELATRHPNGAAREAASRALRSL